MKSLHLPVKRTFFISSLSGAILMIFAFGGCKNELDLTDDYKDIIVCYGILNPYDSVQYVRVDKVFLGESNAYVSAQNNDSISFAPGRISVLVQQWNGGQLLNTYSMRPDTTFERDSGIFSHPYMVIYKGTFPVLKDGSTYKMIVTDLVKGTTVDASTTIPQDITMVGPSSNFSSLNLWDTTLFRVKFKSGQYGYRYSMFLRFHYTEQFVVDTTQVSEKYVDWHFGEQDATTDDGNEFMEIAFVRHKFLDFLASHISEDPMVRRVSGKVDLCFTGANQELASYIDIGIAINNSLSPVEPYTNINGGFGIFAARTTTYSLNYSLDLNTRTHIHNETEMIPLNFIR